MLPGCTGHLISESYLERVVDAQQGITESGAARRRMLAAYRAGRRRLGPASGLRTLFEIGAEPFVRALGHARPMNIAFEKDLAFATVRCPSAGSVALVVATWGARLDPLWRPAVAEAVRRHAPWCVLFNGINVRLINASRAYSRRHLDFDLDLALDDERTCAALTLLLHAQVEATAPRLEDLVDQSDRHSAVVCRSLRDGVLEASARILGALIGHGPREGGPHGGARRGFTRSPEGRHYDGKLDDAFEQALVIVYRILFLLFAEARHLVPLWHPIYRESYSLEALCAASEPDRVPPGLWDSLRAISRLAHAGCQAGDLHVTPFNGRLFAPSRTPLAERRNLDDAAARDALVALATRAAPDRAGREPIAYRDLGVEQLGAVYETLLDYAPRLEGRGRNVSLQPGSGTRKQTGTFYTPLPLARYLVRRALAPLVRDASPAAILALKVLDPAMGSGAFLVASCHFLAEAYESALVQSGDRLPGDVDARERAVIRRMVAERCLFGVDANPMAVQLARLSLWLATLAADRPLSFLDHHLQTGDSLVGAWLASLRHPPSLRRRRAPGGEPSLFEESDARSAVSGVMPVRLALADEPHDTLDQIRRKDQALTAINRPDTPLSKWKRVADLWCALWFSSGSIPGSAFRALADAILTGHGPLPDHDTRRLLDASQTVAASRRFFHWELEFPEAFFDRDGARLAHAGFDAVVGNPPWDMVRADAGSAETRTGARGDSSALVRFTRDSGAYAAQSSGQVNRYQLFAERAVRLARPGGRIGLVLPAGVAADQGSAPLRRLLFSQCGVEGLVGFDNRDGVFPIHRSVRFLLMTATNGSPTTTVGCRFGERDPSVLDTEPDDGRWFPVCVSPMLLEKVSGPDLALPDLRSPVDLTILERVAVLFPPLGDERGWGARFGRELNITDDRSIFRRPGAGLPLLEGKHVEPFRARTSSPRWSVSRADADRLLGRRHHHARLAYRDVASPSNRLTLIAAILPAETVSAHTLFCLRTRLPPRVQHFLCGLFNSFVLNYLVRLRVSSHVTTAIVERLPVPRLTDDRREFREISVLARVLARRASPESAARLNALVAHLYQLTAEELAHMLDTFPLVPRDERDGTLRAFERQSLHRRL
jgi:hypothetical protein